MTYHVTMIYLAIVVPGQYVLLGSIKFTDDFYKCAIFYRKLIGCCSAKGDLKKEAAVKEIIKQQYKRLGPVRYAKPGFT